MRLILIFVISINILFSMSLCKNRYKFSYVCMNMNLYTGVTKEMLNNSYKHTLSSCKIKELFDKVNSLSANYKKPLYAREDCIFCLMRILILNDKNQQIIIRKDKKVINVDKKIVFTIDEKLIDSIIEELSKKVGVKDLRCKENRNFKNAIELSP